MNDQSYGIIPFRLAAEGFLFLVIQHTAGHWSFPKGHPNPGETPQQTALRELTEETGISRCTILPNAPIQERYTFPRDNQTIHKTVDFFLGEVTNAPLHPRPGEITACAWLSYAEALERITYPESTTVLQEAYQVLTSGVENGIANGHREANNQKSGENND